ncbi:MAG: response regulator [Desulfobacterales bacterium]|nr:response regulator [Desulfobacterales bacterium]
MENTILLVDDEEGIRKVLGISLEDSGYAVLKAENGDRALELFLKHRPQIVLTDIKMPGMDGISLLKAIKREDPDTEVIMITGHGDMDLAIQSLKLEATDFVTKPINDDVLEIALKRANDRLDMRRQLSAYTENLEKLVAEKSARLVELERLAALGQAVDGLSAAIVDIAGDLEGGIRYFNEMPCFVSIHNRQLKILAANQLYKDRLGDKIGSDSWDIYSSVKDDGTDCPAARTFETGRGQRRKETLRYADGSQFPVIVHTAPITNTSGELELVLEISVDISEVQRLQEELRSSRERYQQLFDEVPCYISVQDRNFKLTAVNRKFKETFGEHHGEPCFQSYKNRQGICADCPVEKTFEDGRSHQSEMVVTANSGRQINVLVSTAPIYDAAGEIAHVMEMATDITQIRKLQDHLASLGMMIGSISHGVKGILTGLDAGVYLLTSGLNQANGDKVTAGVDAVKTMSDRIQKLFLDILYYAKDRPLRIKDVTVKAFTTELAAIATPKFANSEVVFTQNIPLAAGRFQVDSMALQSALISIIENALDACRDDDTKQKHTVYLEIEPEPDEVVLRVMDNGTGIEPENHEKMFTLFFSSKGHRGTGFGLYLAREIVEQHHGVIKAASTPGQQTVFTLRLPRVYSGSPVK